MRALCVVLLGLAAFAAATPIDELEPRLVTLDIKEKQIIILKLLNHVMQPLMYKELEDLGRNFKIDENVDMFTKTEVVKRFVNIYKTGLLPRGEIFTLHVDRQLKQVVTAFHMLFYAKDFATFIKTACWMRIHMNEGMFVYALTVACRHRDDCRGIVLPAPYEVYPYYFVRGDVIQKAYLLKMKKGLLDNKLCEMYGIRKTDKDVYIIDENVYDTRVYLSDEDRLRYFTEDVDLNTYYYYFHVDYPFWMRDEVFDKLRMRRGEVTLYVYQQILARYYLERLSNGLGEIKTLSWNKPIRKGFWPWLTLHNGVQLPVRMNNYVIAREDNINVIRLVEDCEMIIKEAILKGFIEIKGIRYELTKPEDIEILGRIIYGTVEKTDLDKTRVDAYRYLLILMKTVLGIDGHRMSKLIGTTTVLDSYQTALRDPVFYKLQKRMVDFLILFKRRLPSYTREELYFPGVKIDNIVVDKLVTYFDDFLMDITNGVILTEEELKKGRSDMIMWVRKRRLNHQPFKLTIDVMSDKAIDSVVRIFLGPKKDNLDRLIDININRLNFVELDSFMWKLDTGKNTIVRNSMDMHNLVRDRVMTRDLWKKIDGTSDLRSLLIKDLNNYNTGFPTRLLLPKGRVGGMEMMMYVVITPLKMVDNFDQNMLPETIRKNMLQFRHTVLLDKMPLGFPLDRPIDVTRFYTPNMKFVDVVIFHKKQVCDMKTRWERYVLRDYNMIDRTNVGVDNMYTDSIDNVRMTSRIDNTRIMDETMMDL